MSDLASLYAELENQLDQLRGDSPPGVRSLSRELQEIIHFIHQDPFNPDLTVKLLKCHCQIRDNNISCRFRHSVGSTIKRYIEDLRVEAACHLLRRISSLSVFDIALAVGYSYPQTFYNAFRRKVGCTPAAFRKRTPHPSTSGMVAATSIAPIDALAERRTVNADDVSLP